MNEIELTQGYAALVDERFFDILSQANWYADVARASKVNVYARNLKLGKMHRYIAKELLGWDIEGKIVDHIDGDGLHNYESNFRVVANTRENSRNQKGRKSSPNSPYIGVSWREHTKRWQAQIKHNKELTWLGYFNTPEEAGMAYDRAVLYYFPTETSILNFPDRMSEHDLSLPYERKLQKLRPTNTTGYRGVSERYKGFGASIGRGRGEKRIFLGTFKNVEDAALVYDMAYIILHGVNNDVLNFPGYDYQQSDMDYMREFLKSKIAS